MCIQIYLFLVLSLSIITTISSNKFEKTLNRYVKIENSHGDYLKKVILNNKASFEITLYAPLKEKHKINLSNPFYYVITCMFAQWTINKLYYDILEVTPLFYQRELLFHDEYEDEYTESFINSLNKFEHTINKFIIRFIYLIYNYFDLNPDSTYYNDNSILKAFVSLKVKMMFISKNYQTKSHDDIIRIFLNEFNALQNFLVINCSDRLIIQNNNNVKFDSQVQGYWIQFYDNRYHEYSNNENSEHIINDFLSQIQHLYSISEPKVNCSLTQLLLENIAFSSPKNPITFNISNAKLKITNTDIISIKDMLNQVKISYDIEKLFWYQDSVLSAFIKLICSKIINILKSGNYLSETIIDKIKKINNLINHHKKLPAYLIEGFTILTEVIDKKINAEHLLFKTLQTYHDSFIIILPNENDISSTSYEQNWNDYLYLEKCMDRIINNFEDFQCFNQSFQYLRDEHDKYYIPLIEKKNTFLHINPINGNDQSNLHCYFVINIYTISFHANIIMNQTSDDTSSNKSFLLILRKTIYNIRDYLVDILKTKTENFDLLQMSYNIVTILVNLPEKSVKNVPLFPFRRALILIMTELNNYGLKYCISLKFDFLLHNNIKFMNFSNNPNNKNDKQSILNNLKNIIDNRDKENLIFQKVQENDYNYLNIKFLYDNFIKKSNIIKLHNENIMINWNGRKQTIKCIYKESINIVLNPKCVYAHYDVYFKFFIAVLYLKLKTILDSNETSMKKSLSILNKDYNINKLDFTIDIFPKELNPLISDIKSFFISIVQKSNETLNTEILDQLKEKSINIENKFKKYNIFFIYNSFMNIKNIHIKLNSLYDPFKLLIKEFNTNVTTVKHYFSMLKR